MHKRSYYIVNAITVYRIIAAPALILLVLYHRLDIFRWLLPVSFFTDAIDGFLSRRYKVASIAGSKLDSIGDDLTILASIAGTIVFKPALIRQEIVLSAILIGLFLLQVGLAMLRYRRMTSFHTYMAKMAMVFQGVFFILLFFLPDTPYGLFHVAAAVTIIDLLEEIILVLILPAWQANVRGIYWVIRNKRTTAKSVGMPGQ